MEDIVSVAVAAQMTVRGVFVCEAAGGEGRGERGPLPQTRSREDRRGHHLCRCGCAGGRGGRRGGDCSNHGQECRRGKPDHSSSHGDTRNPVEPESCGGRLYCRHRCHDQGSITVAAAAASKLTRTASSVTVTLRLSSRKCDHHDSDRDQSNTSFVAEVFCECNRILRPRNSRDYPG